MLLETDRNRLQIRSKCPFCGITYLTHLSTRGKISFHMAARKTEEVKKPARRTSQKVPTIAADVLADAAKSGTITDLLALLSAAGVHVTSDKG
jgi:hypothetical protein